MKKSNLFFSVLLVLTILVFLSCEKTTTESSSGNDNSAEIVRPDDYEVFFVNEWIDIDIEGNNINRVDYQSNACVGLLIDTTAPFHFRRRFTSTGNVRMYLRVFFNDESVLSLQVNVKIVAR